MRIREWALVKSICVCKVEMETVRESEFIRD